MITVNQGFVLLIVYKMCHFLQKFETNNVLFLRISLIESIKLETKFIPLLFHKVSLSLRLVHIVYYCPDLVFYGLFEGNSVSHNVAAPVDIQLQRR